ncbi:DUF1836 domain-containing protein [Clostridium sp. HCP1S3_B4]|uniref:DUF1836 domain-containing protein n=1 Tax=unclassified Clostridium TaxID=2614128 RepID=UPI001697B2BA|nr:DUF1836 domain-containing protein [Clostridiales bacterium]MDY2730112.1 DUF1836 domain-containing protein [Clostridium sp.]NLK24850.1 DUF1836 domain-containing protein [Clostridiales bacterium]
MNKDEISKLVQDDIFQQKIDISEFPEIDLYMDQVIQLFESKLSSLKRNKDDKILTKTMINNYAKAKLFMKIKNKKYTKEHLILMSLIYELKGVLSINDTKTLLNEIVESKEDGKDFDLEGLYNEYVKITDQESDFIKDHLLKRLDYFFDGKEEEDFSYKQKFLLITTVVSLSNMYRRMAETMIDEFFGKEDKK